MKNSFREGFVVSCISMFTCRTVDPTLIWMRLSPCLPDLSTQNAWAKAAELNHVGYVDLDNRTFEKTPDVGISVEAFKSRRPKP